MAPQGRVRVPEESLRYRLLVDKVQTLELKRSGRENEGGSALGEAQRSHSEGVASIAVETPTH